MHRFQIGSLPACFASGVLLWLLALLACPNKQQPTAFMFCKWCAAVVACFACFARFASFARLLACSFVLLGSCECEEAVFGVLHWHPKLYNSVVVRV